MKFRCDKSKLIDVINTVQRAIAAKSTLPVLECIKIESKNSNSVIMTGSNIELCIEYTLECDVIEGGSIAIASKIFGEIIRKMPDGNVLIEVNESNNVTRIKGGASEFNIQGKDITDYPETPKISEEFSFHIEEQILKKLIRKTLPFISTNTGKRAILTGGLFDIKNNYLNVVTTDSHRIAVVKEELKDTIDDVKIVVPGQTLRELLKILHDDDHILHMTVGDRKLLIDFGSFQVYTNLLDGEFFKYEAIIRAVNPIYMQVNKKTFMDSLERSMLMINEDMSSSSENKVPVRLNIGYDKVDISCITAKGQVSDSINVKLEGGELVIGFNCRFLLDAMNVCDDDVICMELSAPTSGCFIKPADGGDSFVYMVLPVRLYN